MSLCRLRQSWHGAFLTWEAHGRPWLHRLLLAQDHHVPVLQAIGGQGPVVVGQRPLRINDLCQDSHQHHQAEKKLKQKARCYFVIGEE